MAFLLSRTYISNDLNDLLDACIRLSKLEDGLDLLQLFSNGVVTLTRYKDHAMDVLFESRNPIRRECGSSRSARVTKILSSREHASIIIKGVITKFVGDSQLKKRKLESVAVM